MSGCILDKAYAIEDSAGAGVYLVVVQGSAVGGAKLPAASNAGSILGVTVHSQSYQGANVAVRKAGIARVKAAGVIALGAPVMVAGESGKVKAIPRTLHEALDAGCPQILNQLCTINCIGFAETAASADGDVIEVFLSFHQRVV